MTPAYRVKHRRKNRLKATPSTAYGRATCPVCREVYALAKSGNLRAHRVGLRELGLACRGSGGPGLPVPFEQAPEDELTC